MGAASREGQALERNPRPKDSRLTTRTAAVPALRYAADGHCRAAASCSRQLQFQVCALLPSGAQEEEEPCGTLSTREAKTNRHPSRLVLNPGKVLLTQALHIL